METVTVAFIGHAKPDMIERASAFEDEALALLVEMGGTVLFRGQRVPDTDQALPAEVHILSFPSRQTFNSFLQHERRQQILEKHGEIFESKVVVEVSAVDGTASSDVSGV